MNYLVDTIAVLEKFSGKSGWTYIAIPEIKPNPKMPFGWVIVSGFIDTYPLKKIKLLPKGDGTLFLAVKAEIRKKIKKQAGDSALIRLYIDTTPQDIPQEILDCFSNESSKIYTHFINLPERQQKAFLDWIYTAKTDLTKVNRIAKMMDTLSKGSNFSHMH